VESRWFEFGVVRGIVGAVVGIPIGLYLMKNVHNPITSQGLGVMGSTGFTANPSLLIVGAIIGIIITGAIFELGDWVCRKLEIRANGVWAPIAVGVIGNLVATIIALAILSAILIPTNPIIANKVISATLLALPASLIVEAGYDAITYGIYKLANWPAPESI